MIIMEGLYVADENGKLMKAAESDKAEEQSVRIRVVPGRYHKTEYGIYRCIYG